MSAALVVDLASEAKLVDAMRQELESEDPPKSLAELVAIVYESPRHRPLVDTWARDRVSIWALEHMRKLARPLMKPAPDPLQSYLPGLTFRARVPLLEGTFVPLRHATIRQLRESIKAMRDRHAARLEPKLEQMQQLVNEMSPYAQTHHGAGKPLTVEGYCRMKADGEPVPVVPSTQEHARILKERFALKRRAVALKREAAKRTKRAEI
jgi:hypothetical protein